jgi:hypothetical protein
VKGGPEEKELNQTLEATAVLQVQIDDQWEKTKRETIGDAKEGLEQAFTAI